MQRRVGLRVSFCKNSHNRAGDVSVIGSFPRNGVRRASLQITEIDPGEPRGDLSIRERVEAVLKQLADSSIGGAGQDLES